MTQDFAKVFHTTPSVPSMVTTHKFPADPTLLGADWLTAAYGQDDKPSDSPEWSRQTVTQTLGLCCLVVLSAWSLHSQTALGTNKEYQTGSGQPLTRFGALGDQQLGEPKQGFARCMSGSMTLPKPPVTNDALPSQEPAVNQQNDTLPVVESAKDRLNMLNFVVFSVKACFQL